MGRSRCLGVWGFTLSLAVELAPFGINLWPDAEANALPEV